MLMPSEFAMYYLIEYDDLVSFRTRLLKLISDGYFVSRDTYSVFMILNFVSNMIRSFLYDSQFSMKRVSSTMMFVHILQPTNSSPTCPTCSDN